MFGPESAFDDLLRSQPDAWSASQARQDSSFSPGEEIVLARNASHHPTGCGQRANASDELVLVERYRETVVGSVGKSVRCDMGFQLWPRNEKQWQIGFRSADPERVNGA